jgi:6-oxo-cyclohex-1-ene-carbonyl-CoA hydrolase
MRLFNDMVSAILACDKPVICRVNGMRIAGGQEIGMACDFTVARTGRLGELDRATVRRPTAGTDFCRSSSVSAAMTSCTLCSTGAPTRPRDWASSRHRAGPQDRRQFVPNPLVTTDRWVDNG